MIIRNVQIRLLDRVRSVSALRAGRRLHAVQRFDFGSFVRLSVRPSGRRCRSNHQLEYACLNMAISFDKRMSVIND